MRCDALRRAFLVLVLLSTLNIQLSLKVVDADKVFAGELNANVVIVTDKRKAAHGPSKNNLFVSNSLSLRSTSPIDVKGIGKAFESSKT